MALLIRKPIWIVALLGNVLNNVRSYTHPGESFMLPNERTTLDDCHLRFYEFSEQQTIKPNISKHFAVEHSFEQMAAIGWVQPDGNVFFQCGGSLIWDNFVLTAAHCAVDSKFSDYNLSNSTDDKFVQEIKIAEVIRHPEYRFSANYHDIALIRLEKNAIVNENLVPACLWTDMEIRFKQLEAAGWGRLGFVKDFSPTLRAATFQPMPNDQCAQFYNRNTTRQLKYDLADHHICGYNPRSDTCGGDSGGPLQIKLMHNMRKTPFIVALTSFGRNCDRSLPGVYTKVAPYHDWIIATMRKRGANVDDNTYNMTQCAHRYAKYRAFYDEFDKFSTEANLSVKSYVFTGLRSRPWHIAKLGWHNEDGQSNCYGMILDEDTILTVADCTVSNGTPVGKIVEPSVINITKIHIHPRYSKGLSYNNIAVLKLGALLEVGLGVKPACIWMAYNWTEPKAKVIGIGRTDLVKHLLQNGEITSDSQPLMVNLDNVILNASNCIISDRNIPRMPHGLAREHVCLGKEYFLVPETCDLLIGAPLGQAELKNERYYHYTLALTQFGRDCGFGEPMIATRLASHIDWLSSVLLPGNLNSSGNIVFLNDALAEGDSCQIDQGIPGRCVSVSECFDDWHQFVARGNVSFCSTTAVICYPLDILGKNFQKPVVTELERCPALLRELNPDYPAGHLMEIGFIIDDGFYFRCLGSIITRELVLTTASCIEGEGRLELSLLSNSARIAVNSTIIHENYNATDKINDIALIKMNKKLIWSSDVHPACLWMNRTHTPLVMKMPLLDGNALRFKYILPMYNSDCQRMHPFQLRRSQLCGKGPFGATACMAGYVLLSEPDGVIKYLVGMAQPNKECKSRRYLTFTRISAMVDWIKPFLESDGDVE